MGLFESATDKRNREALAWVQALHREPVSDEQILAYTEWMEADSLNADVFRQLDEAWISTGDSQDAIRATFGPEARDTRRKTIAEHLSTFIRPGFTPQFAAAVATVVLLVLSVLPTTEGNVSTQQFATAVGETKAVALADGSFVTLNTGSELTITYEDEIRLASVSQGGALFDVAPDSNRPFVVDVNGGTIEVLGTVFDVLGNAEGFEVTVLEGRVSVVAGSSDSDRATLEPNQRAAVNTQLASLNVSTIDATAAVAWRDGQLIYRNATIFEVLSDLNRYSDVPLRVADALPDNLEFTDVLNISEPSLMMERLAGLMRMTVVETEDGGLRLDPID